MAASRAEMWDHLKHGRFIDMTICVGDTPFECHKVVLASVPGYFRDLFSHDFAECHGSPITLRISDPYSLFGRILEYFYLGDTSFVTPELAIPVYLLAIYFRLDDLKKVSEEILGRIDTLDINFVVHQIQTVELPCLPEPVADFLARFFHDETYHTFINQLLPAMIVQVVMSPRLRIVSEAQLGNFIASSHKTHRFPPASLARLLSTVEWLQILPDEWQSFDWGSLITTGRHNVVVRKHLDISRKYPRFSRLALAIESERPLVEAMGRYFPPCVRSFELEDNIFDRLADYEIDETNFERKGPMIQIQMTAQNAIHINKLELVVLSFQSVAAMGLTFISVIDGVTKSMDYMPTKENGRAVFKAEPPPKLVSSTVTIRLVENRAPKVESLRAAGFVYTY